MPASALPKNLLYFDKKAKRWKSTKHWDWPWPFKYIPRGWTAFKWGLPTMKWCHIPDGKDWYIDTAFHPKPITSPGTWQISRFPNGPWFAWYFAYSGRRGPDGKYRHFRIGARWDNVDNYVEFPTIAMRRYTGQSEDTGTK
jgi:hypothetical protein